MIAILFVCAAKNFSEILIQILFLISYFRNRLTIYKLSVRFLYPVH